jgi:thioredoxin 1
MSNIVTDSNFENNVIKSEQLVLVDFWAEWCSPCKQMLPTLEEISHDMKKQVRVFKMDVDESPETPVKYGIRSIPTFKLFKKGEVVSTRAGLLTKAAMVDWIKEYF